MLKVFIGYDTRQPVAYQVLSHSIYKRSSAPVSITPLVLSQLPIKRRGLTEFTYSRYLVPWLCGYSGRALFLDADMLCLGDIKELFDITDTNCRDVCVVKNKERFEWPSLMLFNNSRCQILTPEYIEKEKPQTFEWAVNGVCGLPDEWNHCVGYDKENPKAKLVHFTAGIPCFPETQSCEFSKEWNQEAFSSTSSVGWKELMGNSVHAKRMGL